MTKKKQEEIKSHCDNCKFYIDGKCEHESNIKYFIHRRIEIKGYKSLEEKSECEFCQN